MDIFDSWMDDFPQQFLGKKMIGVLVKAFARQMEEVRAVYEELNTKTDIGTAYGEILDHVGTIVPLSRKEAHAIIRKADAYEITDEIYRKVLQFQTVRNNCDCTYGDVMGTMHMLWKLENIRYREDSHKPATIYIDVPAVSIDSADQTMNRILAVKPAGVGIIYSVGYAYVFYLYEIEKVNVDDIVIGMRIPFWKMRTLDGSWTLDGSDMLDEVIVPMESNARITIGAVMDGIVERAEADVTIKKDFWCLDGECLFDGTKKLDAEMTKEVL